MGCDPVRAGGGDEGRDVVAVPSRAESLPRVAKEAVALGRPVLASRVAGLPEVVTDGRSGWLIGNDDVGGWHQRISQLAAEPSKARALMASDAPPAGDDT